MVPTTRGHLSARADISRNTNTCSTERACSVSSKSKAQLHADAVPDSAAPATRRAAINPRVMFMRFIKRADPGQRCGATTSRRFKTTSSPPCEWRSLHFQDNIDPTQAFSLIPVDVHASRPRSAGVRLGRYVPVGKPVVGVRGFSELWAPLRRQYGLGSAHLSSRLF